MKVTRFEDLEVWMLARELCRSCGEVRSQSYRAFDQSYINEKEHKELLDKTDLISRKISNLAQYLKKTPYRGPKFD